MLDDHDVPTIEKMIRKLLRKKKVEVRPDEKPTFDELELFYSVCDELSRRMFGVSDGDDDSTVEVRLTDRTREYRGHFRNIPYGGRGEPKDTIAEDVRVFRICQYNLSVAQGQFDTAYRIFDDAVLRPLLSTPVQFNSERISKLLCITCDSGFNKAERRDDGLWQHQGKGRKTRVCEGSIFHEAQYKHEQESEGEEHGRE